MRTFGDAPRLPAFAAGPSVAEPGAERPFPDCSCPAPPLGVDSVRFLTEVQLVAVLDAAHVACLHRCPGWPPRRREGGPPSGPRPISGLE